MTDSSSVPRWRRYLRLVRPNVAADVDEELSFHIAMRVLLASCVVGGAASLRAKAVTPVRSD